MPPTAGQNGGEIGTELITRTKGIGQGRAYGPLLARWVAEDAMRQMMAEAALCGHGLQLRPGNRQNDRGSQQTRRPTRTTSTGWQRLPERCGGYFT